MRTYFKFFTGSTVFAVLALATAFFLGLQTGGTLSVAFSFLFTALMLGILETSLSFDNAVVNARILATMAPFWRKIYLYIGMIISVFGMRVLFPLLIVWLVSSRPFGDVIAMTWQNPQEFQDILVEQHTMIAGFGGAFLWMVFSSFFFDAEKDLHWLPGLESVMSRVGKLPSVPVVFTLLITLGFFTTMPSLHRLDFLLAAVLGVILYLLVSGLGALMHNGKLAVGAGLGSFLYLEVQDASFSFDGVIGAFAITNNLFLIALGLGIGAFFVRSMTIKLVEDKTLGVFRYLEHGAFWAIGALSLIMDLGALEVEVPEVVAGSVGIILIALSVLGSIVANRRDAKT
ncbi:MAG: DUF475 domain-containing protein [Spirochaetales bacterium]